MRGNQLLAVLSGCAALTIATAACASMSAPMGWYLEGNFGSSRLSNVDNSSNRSGIGGNANVGYKFMPYFATEIGYSMYANTSIESGNITVVNQKHYSYDLAGKGILPIGDAGFEAFAKVGVQRINLHNSINDVPLANSMGLTGSQHSATGLYLGLGGQYSFMPEVAANIQWQRAQGNSTTGTEDLYTFGLAVIFD